MVNKIIYRSIYLIHRSSTVFHSDARSVLQGLEGDRHPHLVEGIQKVAKERRVALQWIPGHCRIPENEVADRLAKLGTK